MSASSLLLPNFLARPLDSAALAYLRSDDMPFDFTTPPGEQALVPPDSVSWRIFKNPVALLIGGVAAVILELAEPAVRTGVWDYSSFKNDPVRRLKRTGLAAMITVYGARSKAEAMTAHVVRMHDRVAGNTPSGEAYRANDPKLLTWVQATASFGFSEAYSRFVRTLTPDETDRFYAEGAPVAELYGAINAPRSDAERQMLFESFRDRLEASPIVFEFLDIMNKAPALPASLKPMQRLMVRAAVDVTPEWLRDRLGLGSSFGLRSWERPLVRAAGFAGDHVLLRSGPAAQSSLRLGLPAEYLYRTR